jgi:hypothetical protein
MQVDKKQWGENLFGQALDATRKHLDNSSRLKIARQYDKIGVR